MSMHILLTNDDGIDAPGLRALAEALTAAGHRVSVCAPHRERSAAGHSAVIGRALLAEPVEYPLAERAWQSDSTPADCARLGIYLTRDDPVDMVVSGINRGMNLGGACVYSGTVGAAIEAGMCGVQALAVSLCVPNDDGPHDYAPAAKVAARVAAWMPAHNLPRGCAYNLNVPAVPYEAIRGLVPAPLGPVFLSDADYRPDAKANYYHYVFRKVPLSDPTCDVARIDDGYATLTKLTWDMRLNADDSDMNEIGL